MAKIYIRRNKNSVDGTGNVIDNRDGRTTNGNGDDSSIGRESSNEPNNDDSRTTTNDNVIGESVTGNSTQHANKFDPNDYEYVNPVSATNNGSEDGRSRKRRSDAGTKRGTRTRRVNETQTTQDLKSLLLTVHFGLAGLLHAPKMKLTEQEAETLSTAIKRVTDLYDVRIIPEKQMAWLNLMITAGCIYVPRLRKDKKDDKEQATSNARVVQMPMTQPVSQGVQ